MLRAPATVESFTLIRLTKLDHTRPPFRGEAVDRRLTRNQWAKLMLRGAVAEIDVGFHSDCERPGLGQIDQNLDHVNVGLVALPA